MSVIGNTALSLGDEEAMLLDYARSFCADLGGVALAREHLEQPQEFSSETWSSMVEMGWTGLGLDEAVGGVGLDIGAAIPVVESMGRTLLGTPLVSTLLAAQLLQRAGGAASAEILSSIAEGEAATVALLESEDWFPDNIETSLDANSCVFGTKQLVMDAEAVRWIVVVVSRENTQALAVVDARQLGESALSPRTMIDLTHRAADVHFAGESAVLTIEGDEVAKAISDYYLLGALLVAAESTGAAATCLDTIVDYLKTRKQFGKLIGSYQALKHPAVEILKQVDSARSFIYHAATLVGAESLSKDAEVACRMAKAQATDAIKFAGDRAVQFHGGMGFTWDCDAQLFVRRAQWAQQQFGDSAHHRQRLAAILLGS